ncbi:MAG: hypothetical protein AAFX87_14150 [Bacteroidota bacterium]
MTTDANHSKLFKTLCIIGSSLLIIMAGLHGSGTTYLTEKINQSNASSLIKEVFPVLFVLPSIELLGLAAFSLLTLTMKSEVEKVLALIVILIVVNAALAFYLGALIPGLLIVGAASCFAFAGWERSKRQA